MEGRSYLFFDGSTSKTISWDVCDGWTGYCTPTYGYTEVRPVAVFIDVQLTDQ
jgi:hypothetical protein